MYRALCAAVLGIGLSTAAPAQSFTPDPVDRAAAVREGHLNWYSSTPFPLVQALADRFQQETGIKVSLLRSGGEAVLRRFMQEYQAGRAGADVVTMSDAGAANGLVRQGVFVPFRPEGFDKVLDFAKEPKGHWIAQRISLVGMPVRTDRVSEKDRPRTWSDLTAPKFKGMMVMADPSFTAIQLIIVGMLSQKFGWEFYRALRKNDTMIVPGHQQVYKTLQQGERLIGTAGADPRRFNNGQEVPNQSLIYPSEGVFIVVSPTGIARNARNPDAARLFAQFMISPAVQQLIADNQHHSSRGDIAAPPGQPGLHDVTHIPIDLDFIETRARALKKRFSEIFQ
jgi:iron(III) transport system substrate-binding protein